MTEIKTGTKEWADKNINIQKGCKYGCLYCYAMKMAIRFKRIEDYDEWVSCVIILKDKVNRSFSKRKGRIMFPSTHDIYHENYDDCITVLKSLLKSGNEVLITSKPNPNMVRRMVIDLHEYKNQIQFRFTITSLLEYNSSYYEPYAPTPSERIRALVIAYNACFKTSVSIEPYLDADLIPLISRVEPYCTETIWVGIMGHGVPKRLKHIYKYSHIRYNLPHWIEAGKGKLRLKDRIKKMGFKNAADTAEKERIW